MNVRRFANETGTVDVIERAITFDARLEKLWLIPVVWNDRLRKSYGRGGPTHYGIKLHPALRTNPEQFRKTFLHELAHCMEYILYRKCGHGQSFWEAMIRLGEKPWERFDHNGLSLQTYANDKRNAAMSEIEASGLLS